MTLEVLPAEALALAEWVNGLQVGTIRVLDVKLSLDADVNNMEAVFFDLYLTDPLPGMDTWVTEDMLALHRLVGNKARELSLHHPWYVRLIGGPEAGDEDEDDE